MAKSINHYYYAERHDTGGFQPGACYDVDRILVAFHDRKDRDVAISRAEDTSAGFPTMRSITYRAILDSTGRFVGGRWARDAVAELEGFDYDPETYCYR